MEWNLDGNDKKKLPIGVILFILIFIGGPIGLVLALIIGGVWLVSKVNPVTAYKKEAARQVGDELGKTGEILRQKVRQTEAFVRQHTEAGSVPQRQSHTDTVQSSAAKTSRPQPVHRGQSQPIGHDFQRNMGLSRKQQLDQLKTLKEAGLYSEREYQAARRKIMQETEL